STSSQRRNAGPSTMTRLPGHLNGTGHAFGQGTRVPDVLATTRPARVRALVPQPLLPIVRRLREVGWWKPLPAPVLENTGSLPPLTCRSNRYLLLLPFAQPLKGHPHD